MDTRFRFGDGRPAPFTGNALLLLEEAVKTCGVAVEYASQLREFEGGASAMEKRFEQTSAQLRRAAERCVAQLRREMTGQPPIVATWARAVTKDLHLRVEEQEKMLRGDIESHVERHREGLVVKREALLRALARLVLHPDLPNASETLTMEAAEEGYEVHRAGHSSWGLSWTVASSTTSWSSWLKVRDLLPDIAVETAAQGGVLEALFGRVDVGRLTVLRLERSFPKTRLSLGRRRGKSELDVVFGGPGKVFLLRYDTDGEPQLEVLADEVHAELERLRDPVEEVLREARDAGPGAVAIELDDEPIDSLEQVEALLSRVVDVVAPIASEIARRSPQQDELVLKETVAAGERRELFLDRRRLLGPVAALPLGWRERLAPLVASEAAGGGASPSSPPSSEYESTPAGPRVLPQLYEADELESERTAHGYSAPDVPPAPTAPRSSTQVSASYDDEDG